MNNEMDDFSAKKIVRTLLVCWKKANAIEPGKRMLSSMTPTIVLKNEKPLLVTDLRREHDYHRFFR